MPPKPTKWEQLRAARELLELESSASLEEIKLAYRRLAKVHHPDLAGVAPVAGAIAMPRLTEAYRILTDHCCRYRIPLEPTGEEARDDEEWWLHRFGNDPLWGKGHR